MASDNDDCNMTHCIKLRLVLVPNIPFILVSLLSLRVAFQCYVEQVSLLSHVFM